MAIADNPIMTIATLEGAPPFAHYKVPSVMTTRYGIEGGAGYELSTDPLGNMGEKRSEARGNLVKV
jgi:hypothetical protein